MPMPESQTISPFILGVITYKYVVNLTSPKN